MPDAEFLQVIGERYGGLPTVIAQDPELLALFLPTLRADVLAHETYEYRKEEVLDVPVIGLGGRDDLTVEPARIAGWAEETECFMELMVFPGGHFFIQTEQESVVSFLGKRTIEHLGLSQQPDGSGDSAASGGYKSVSAVSDEG
jgi:surfactin synthase thioesterase subunit